MALIVDPTFVPAPPPVIITSPDGVLTAEVDAAHAGVLLTANYSEAPDTARQVRFYRGDGTPVRSGDPAWAPGGWANAYDHEAPLGVGVSWYCVPVDVNGVEGPASQLVAVELPEPDWHLPPGEPVHRPGSVWLKSVLDPGLSQQVWWEVTPEIVRRGRVVSQEIAGSRYPAASWDRRGGVETTLSLVTSSLAQKAALEALCDVGPLLFQTRTEFGIDDFYFLPGDLQLTYIGTARSQFRRWSLAVTEIARPATLDAPLMIPGRSYDSLTGSYVSYDDMAAQVGSYNGLLGADTEVVENLVTNPSMEATSGTVEVSRNLLKNPSFEVDSDSSGLADGYGSTAGGTYQRIASPWGAGLAQQMVVNADAADARLISATRLPIGPGQTATFLFRHSGPDPGLRVGIEWFDAANAYIGGDYSVPAALAEGDGWYRLQEPVRAGAVSFWVMAYTGSYGLAGDTHVFDTWFACVGSTRYSGDYFDGDTLDDGTFTYSWAGAPHASQSIKTAPDVVGYGGSVGYQVVTPTGGMLEILPTTTSDSFAAVEGGVGTWGPGLVPGKTYTVLGTCEVMDQQTDPRAGRARTITFFYRDAGGVYRAEASQEAPNLAGARADLRVTVTIPPDATEAFIRLYNGALDGQPRVRWDNVLVVEGEYDRNYFDGDTPDGTDGATYAWTGAPHASTSTKTRRIA